MIRGVGLDLVTVSELRQSLARHGRFRQRVYTAAEVAACEAAPDPGWAYAACFGAKEAFAKAVGWGIRAGLSWHDIALDPQTGSLSLAGGAHTLMQRTGARAARVAVGGTGDLCLVFVLLDDRDPTPEPSGG